MTKWAVGLTLALCMGGISSLSNAATVTLAPTGFDGLSGVSGGLTVTIGDINGSQSGGNTTTTTAGAFLWTVNSATTSSAFSPDVGATNFATFCIQAFQTFSGTTTFQLDSLSGGPTGGLDAGSIDATAAKEIQGLINAHWGSGANDVFASATNAAAFQLAVWEIEYDGGSPGESLSGSNLFTTGLVKASGTTTAANNAISTAQSWLNALTQGNVASNTWDIGDFGGNNTQDQLALSPGGSGSAPSTPLPAAMPMGLGLLGGLATVRRLRRKA